jgi:hypothetical protein
MKRLVTVCGLAILLGTLGRTAGVQARPGDRTLAVVMTNDPTSNAIKVYDTESGALIQTLSTNGQGGVGGNARGVRREGDLVAAVNFGSNTVAIFRRSGDRLRFDRLVPTTSAPVSVDFGNGHMYVAGATTIDSFPVRGRSVEWMDGTTSLQVAEGGVPGDGGTAQVGVIDDRHALVTLKTDPTPGTVDIVALRHGVVVPVPPTAVPAPSGTLTPFGFSVADDGTALITLAHSNQDGLFRNGSFTAVVGSGELAPCWTTAVGKYVFTANTASQTISRLVATGANVFIDSAVAATVSTGGPSDLDADAGVMGVIDHGGGQSHLSLFAYNPFGELSAHGAAITVGAANANGVAIVPAARGGDDW